MRQLESIKEAIICTDKGTLEIIIGENLNKENPDYHNRVKVQIMSGGNEILIKGNRVRIKEFCSGSGKFTDENKNFNFWCENIEGFSELVKTESTYKFSWRKLKKVFVRDVKYVQFGEYVTVEFPYKQHLWPVREYKSNNWIITELK